MNSLPLLSSPLAHAIGWALLHLLWQGVIVAGILAAALRLLKNQSADIRYAVSCTALALLLVLGVATAYRAYDPIVPPPVMTAEKTVEPLTLADVPKIIFAAEATETLKSRAATFARSAQTSLPWIVLTWLCGVVLLSSRLMLGWVQTRRIARRDARPASTQWQRIAKRLASALQLRRAVTLLESSAVEVPSVIGWLRPIVLLPGSTLTGLTPEQIEMVLAHELAHIRRHDFFVNLLQAFVETLMFYHPAVWWISAQVRIERENCCDDLAVAVCGNPIQYARALTRLEELRATAPTIAVAANGGSLLDRIRRIAISRDESTATTSRWAAAIALLSILGLALVVPAIPALAQRDDDNKAAAKAAASRVDVIDRHDSPVVADLHDLDDLDIDIDLDLDDIDVDIDALDADLDRDLDLPEPPEAPEPPDFDFDFDFPNVDIAAIAPLPPTPMVPPVPMAAPVPMVAPAPPTPAIARAMAHADRAEHGGGEDEYEHDSDSDDDSDDGRREDGSLSVDALVRLRASGVTPEYLSEMRALFPKASLGEIAGARAVGVTREYINSLKSAGVPVDSFNTVKKLRALGVQPEYIREVRSLDADATYDDIAQARAMGITAEYVQSLRKAGFEIADIDDATRFKAVGVTAEYAREIRAVYPSVTSKEIAEAKAVGVTRAYVEGLRGSGISIDSPRDAVRLRAVGVTPEYIKEMRAAGVKIVDAQDATKLSAMGVRPDFVRRLAAAGYSNLTVRELTRLAAAGVDEDFIRDMKKYRTDDKTKDNKNK
ncbi:MAG TPA: M56 family metallopeptidase [Thermoanaerobaculia bacterium]|jgi:beta-lactamase regulating signal transducer with metallopeptidase domain